MAAPLAPACTGGWIRRRKQAPHTPTMVVPLRRTTLTLPPPPPSAPNAPSRKPASSEAPWIRRRPRPVTLLPPPTTEMAPSLPRSPASLDFFLDSPPSPRPRKTPRRADPTTPPDAACRAAPPFPASPAAEPPHIHRPGRERLPALMAPSPRSTLDPASHPAPDGGVAAEPAQTKLARPAPWPSTPHDPTPAPFPLRERPERLGPAP